MTTLYKLTFQANGRTLAHEFFASSPNAAEYYTARYFSVLRRNGITESHVTLAKIDEEQPMEQPMETLIALFAKKNPEAARALFDARIASETDPDTIARLELAREFLCNPEFKNALQTEMRKP